MLKLVIPSEKYRKEVMDYRKSFIENGEVLAGASTFDTARSFDEWLSVLLGNMDERTVGKDFVVASSYLVVSNKTGELVGMVQIRHRLNDYLLKFGGHIGYSVKKDERNKGYGKEILCLALEKAKDLGLDRVLLTCNKENVPSEKVIIAKGGIFENELVEGNRIVRRYWIDLRRK